jgi:hypothetical protein
LLFGDSASLESAELRRGEFFGVVLQRCSHA